MRLISELRSKFAVGNFLLASCCSLSVTAADLQCLQGSASGGISELIGPWNTLNAGGSVKISREYSRSIEAPSSSSKFGIMTAVWNQDLIVAANLYRAHLR